MVNSNRNRQERSRKHWLGWNTRTHEVTGEAVTGCGSEPATSDQLDSAALAASPSTSAAKSILCSSHSA